MKGSLAISNFGESRVDHELGIRDALSKNDNDQFESPSSRRAYRIFARVVVAEILGTCILMFCISAIIARMQTMSGDSSLLVYAGTACLTVIVLIFAIGPISGAHVNPSVTVAFAIYSHFSWHAVPIYIFAQIVGSILGTYTGMFVFNIKSDLMITRPIQGCSSAFWVELIMTFIIVFLVASLTHQAQSVGNLSGFVVGTAIGLAVLVSGPVSGGSLNPARSLGAAIVSWKFKDLWIYIIAPTIGAIGGALLFQILSPEIRTCNISTISTHTDQVETTNIEINDTEYT